MIGRARPHAASRSCLHASPAAAGHLERLACLSSAQRALCRRFAGRTVAQAIILAAQQRCTSRSAATGRPTHPRAHQQRGSAIPEADRESESQPGTIRRDVAGSLPAEHRRLVQRSFSGATLRCSYRNGERGSTRSNGRWLASIKASTTRIVGLDWLCGRAKAIRRNRIDALARGGSHPAPWDLGLSRGRRSRFVTAPQWEWPRRRSACAAAPDRLERTVTSRTGDDAVGRAWRSGRQ
jgi:hypothetical protein